MTHVPMVVLLLPFMYYIHGWVVIGSVGFQLVLCLFAPLPICLLAYQPLFIAYTLPLLSLLLCLYVLQLLKPKKRAEFVEPRVQ